jgi:hypothetical protein
MADLSKLKRKSSLGAPPPVSEASGNLDAPETAPQAIIATAPLPSDSPGRREGEGTRDGRSARRTGRTVQFATRVSIEFDDRLRTIAQRDGLMLVEVLERALDAYEKRAFRDN